MPEMTDAMYCHQQICIPPTFPFLLRQYAKAAIRSQPNDLLRWSCSYFRALSLGLRPPAKLRLEYPIPRTHYGMTPGWLKTLLFQLAGHNVVTWPQLYDRWRGACLQLEGLQEILLLAGFNNPARLPWYRFVAVAAGHLTTNLTNTMILICELLTEEPEGGSASIPFATFADLYKFLASIEACEERDVKNFWFTESNLELTKLVPETEVSDRFADLDRSLISAHISDVEEEESEKDRYSDLQKYLQTIEVDQIEEDTTRSTARGPRSASTRVHSEVEPTNALEPDCYIILDPEDPELKICDEVHSKITSSSSCSSSQPSIEQKTATEIVAIEEESEELSLHDQVSQGSKLETVSSTIESSEPSGECKVLKLVAVPGIGGIVKEEVVNAVLKFMREVANKQKGMIMPRNIKHFLCPPLEECF